MKKEKLFSKQNTKIHQLNDKEPLEESSAVFLCLLVNFEPMKFYRYFQAFSIDVAIGSCTMTYLVAKVLRVELPFIVFFSLFMSVWLVYTLDHLLDAKEIKSEAITLRHRLHQKYFKFISWMWLVLFITTCVLSVVFLPPITLKIGLLASILVIAHVFMVYHIGERFSLLIQKELGVAITYTVGILFGPLSLATNFPIYVWLLIAQVFICALINLLEFSYFDMQVDSQQGQVSLARIIGKKTLSNVIIVLIAIGIMLQIYCFYSFPDYLFFQLIISGINFTLVFLFIIKKKLSGNDYYRMIGDFVFLYPSLILLF